MLQKRARCSGGHPATASKKASRELSCGIAIFLNNQTPMPDLFSLERVAITGATGFIGRHLVRKLVSAGCQPVLLARKLINDGWVKGLGERIRWVEVDLTETGSV